MYAGQHGGKKMRLNKNCKNKALLLDEQQPFPLYTRDLNLSVLKHLQPLHCYTQLFAAQPAYGKKTVETNM
jgi:hypothetical protein